MMASNQYGRQWPQNPGPSYQYDNRSDQRHWQENEYAQRSYNQQPQGYNDYQQGRNGFGPGPAPGAPRNDRTVPRQGQGQDQYPQYGGYEEPYYENNNAYAQAPQRDPYSQGPPQGRQYEYDERYRANGQGRPPPPEHSHSESRRPRNNQWSEPSTPQKRPKPRERILTEPASPKNLAWDNPFGAFQQPKKKPTEKEQKHERHTSLDHAMANMTMNERRGSGGHDPRPHTSNSNRREAPRPSTSHDRRPPPPLQGYPMPPGRSSPEMTFQQPPIPKPQGDISSPRIRPSVPGPSRGPQQPGPPSQPMNQERPRLGPGPGSYAAREDHGSQGQYNGQGSHPPQDRRRNNYVHDEGYASDYIPQSRAHVSPIDRMPQGMPSRPEPQPMPQQDSHMNSYRGVPPPNSAEHNRERGNEMPNFDAIPTNVNEKLEDQLVTSSKPAFDQNVYRKPTYQVPGSFPGQPGQIDTSQSKPSPPNQTTSPLAEFSFDLPANTQPMTNGRYELAGQATPYRGVQNDSRNRGVGGAMNGGYGDNQPQELPGSQFPPRSASRNGMKPVVGTDASRPPLPNNGQPYRSFSQDQYPTRPHTSNAQRPPQQSYEAMNPYDQDYTNRAPSAPVASTPFDQGYDAPGQNQPYRQPHGQGPMIRQTSQDNYNQTPGFQQGYGQVPPKRNPPQDNYTQGPPGPAGPPRPTVANSAHPVPVRHYPNLNAPSNPDALPAHPTPVRPGATPNYGYQPSQAPVAQPVHKRDVSGPAPPVTMQELNSLRSMYSSNPGDNALGLKLAKKMVEAAKVLADENGTADSKTTQKNREKYIFDAHKLIKKLVASNYPDAMFYLADCHGQGMLGLAVDPKEAFSLYQSAAKLNHPQSAYRVAVCCELGSEEGGGTRRDPLKAMQWYKRAATLGDPPAMYKMGMILLKGLLSQQKNPREAVSWLKRAAERADKDNPHALHELGLLYESPTPPDNVLRDERYAFQLFQQAAELGYKYSQFRLGSAHEYGLLGCPIDARQSIAWYTRAAAQGEHQSELALSGWYLTGSEPLLTQSDTEAFLWARKAASSGLAKAEYAMGYFNEVGIGTAVDVEEAKRWYYRAASQNFGKARERLEELKRGGPKQQKTRMSRSNVTKQTEGECVVM